MKVYAENSFARYEHLPMHHRKMYWTDYLKRLVEFALHDPDMSSSKHDRILAEISRVTSVIRILQNESNSRTVASKATPKPADQTASVGSTVTFSDANLRPSRKRRPARRRDGARKTARTDNSK